MSHWPAQTGPAQPVLLLSGTHLNTEEMSRLMKTERNLIIALPKGAQVHTIAPRQKTMEELMLEIELWRLCAQVVGVHEESSAIAEPLPPTVRE